MNDYILYALETALTLTLAILGSLLIVRANDNRHKRMWGVMCVLLAVTIFYDNLEWLRQISQSGYSGYAYEVLPPRDIVKWYVAVHAFTLFVLGSFKPGWMTSLRILAFSQPLLATGLVMGCYAWFGTGAVELTNAADILQQIGNTDVQIRLAAFVLSIVNPTVYIIMPLFWRKAPLRKPSRGMYLYMATSITLIIIYITYALFPYKWLAGVYGAVTIGVPALLSFLYLRAENPFSMPPAQTGRVSETSGNGKDLISPIIFLLHQRLVEHMCTAKPFTTADYTPAQLTRELNTNQTLLLQAIKYGGYTCFREYINDLRLKHFKYLATSMPGTSIKELMYRCGFTSRSSFYRHFSDQELISPKKYLENLYRQKGASLSPSDAADE